MGVDLSVNHDEFSQNYQIASSLSAQFATPMIPTRKSAMIANLSDLSKWLFSLSLNGAQGRI